MGQPPSSSSTSYPEPAPVKIIRDLETLRVLTDPLRMRILAALEKEPRTVKEVARLLDIPPTRLYYHFNLLEKHGIIRVVDTRVVSGIIEKRYWITARNFNVAQDLFSPHSPEAASKGAEFITALLETLRQDLAALIEQGVVYQVLTEEDPQGPIVRLTKGMKHLSHTQARELLRRLEALLDEFDTPEEGAVEYTFVVGLYPTPEDTTNKGK